LEKGLDPKLLNMISTKIELGKHLFLQPMEELWGMGWEFNNFIHYNFLLQLIES
jgi:hypothetical protein